MHPVSELGSYQIGKLVAKGRCGLLYHAKHRGSRKKSLLQILSEQAAELLASSSRDVELLKELHHPNILGFESCFLPSVSSSASAAGEVSSAADLPPSGPASGSGKKVNAQFSGKPYLLREWAREDLLQLVEETGGEAGCLGEKQAAWYLRQVCDAVLYLSEKGLGAEVSAGAILIGRKTSCRKGVWAMWTGVGQF